LANPQHRCGPDRVSDDPTVRQACRPQPAGLRDLDKKQLEEAPEEIFPSFGSISFLLFSIA
jgi:hypothetical protein